MESTHVPLSQSTNDSFSTSSQCSLSPVKKENSSSINNFFQMVKKSTIFFSLILFVIYSIFVKVWIFSCS